MSWEFVKRHRRKIATIATAIGGVYAVKKVLDQQNIHLVDWLKGVDANDAHNMDSKLIAVCWLFNHIFAISKSVF